MPREPFSGHLDMLLLAAVQSRPMHGYAIISFVRGASSGQFDYAEGTIYPALRRLEDDGLVRSHWREIDGRRRRVYDIRASGKKALAAQRREWEQFTNGVEAVLAHG